MYWLPPAEFEIEPNRALTKPEYENRIKKKGKERRRG
jgi:hypothetical protein